MSVRIFLVILISNVNSQPSDSVIEKNTKNHEGAGELLSSIVTKHFPSCGVVLVSDTYFRTFLVRWLQEIKVPIWTIVLDKAPGAQNANKTTIHHESSGFSGCTTIIVCCLKKETCRTEYSEGLFRMLLSRGIIRSERRSFLFINNDEAALPSINYERENTIRFSTDVMNFAQAILLEIQSHITLIRRVKSKKGLRNAPTYQLLTFTPNWIPGGSPVIEAYWSLKLGLVGEIQLKAHHIRSNENSTINVALPTFNLPPYVEVKEGKETKGMEDAAIKLLAHRFNLTVKYHEAEDFTFGKKTIAGRWSGVIGEVVRRKADLGLGQIIFTYDRKETGLKFTNTIVMLRGTVVCPAPQLLSSWLTLILPFEIFTWAALLAAVVLVIGLAEVLELLFRYCWKERRRVVRLPSGRMVVGTVVKRPKTLSWVYFVASGFQKSIPGKVIPLQSGLRLYFGFWSIFTFLACSFYGCLLFSKWAVRPTAKTIEFVEDLVRHEEQWSMSRLVMETLQNSQYSVEQKLVEDAFRIDTEDSSSEQYPKEFQYVLETGHCSVVERTRAKYIIANKLSKKHRKRSWKATVLRHGKGVFLLGPSGWVLRSDTDFLFYNFVNDITYEFRERGLIRKAARVYFPAKVNAKTKINTARPLTLESFSVPFYLLLCGLLLSLGALFLEILFFGLLQIRRLQMQERKVK